MTMLSRRNARTLTGYVERLLDYPRWVIERDIDFTDCHFQGAYTASDKRCTTCLFGDACCWLKLSRAPASEDDDPLADLINALTTAASYLQATHSENHEKGCNCDTCLWLRQARRFLHSQHYST